MPTPPVASPAAPPAHGEPVRPALRMRTRASRSGQVPAVLLVGEAPEEAARYGDALARAGFAVTVARDGAEAVDLLAATAPDLVVLDAGAPRSGGLDLCRRLRGADGRGTMLLVLLVEPGREQDRLRALDAGADLALARSVSPAVLAGQMRALLRSIARFTEAPDVVEVEDLIIDRSRYTVYRKQGGRRITLHFPRQQFELLYFLAAHPGRVFSREELLARLWENNDLMVRTVDVHVRKIRARLGSAYIETVKGIGYRFREQAG